MYSKYRKIFWLLSTIIFIYFLFRMLDNIELRFAHNKCDQSKIRSIPKKLEDRLYDNRPIKNFQLEPTNVIRKMPDSFKKEQKFNYTKKDNIKKILYWNDNYGSKFFGLGYGQLPFKMGECEYQNCFATSNRTKFSASEVDAIIWHFRSEDRSLPNPRYPKAKYIFFMAESASYLYGNLRPFNKVFDYTFTYRSDSDISNRNNIIAIRRVPDNSFLKGDFTKNKTLMAVWFISHCAGKSGRMQLKTELEKHINIDIYGKCGKLSCPRSTSEQCYKMAAKKYFFYLAFENSLCNDYITEKFFNIIKYDIVPVVYGSGPYWKHAPPHSYIDAFDFYSVKELTEYMTFLTKNPAQYNAYFRWKTYYLVLPTMSRIFASLCKMCELLNVDEKIKKKTTSRYDLMKWFVQGSQCMTEYTPAINFFISGQNQTLTVNECRKNKNL